MSRVPSVRVWRYMHTRAPEGVHRMVNRPWPRAPGSVSHTSLPPTLALLVPASISRVVITPPWAALTDSLRGGAIAVPDARFNISVALAVAVLLPFLASSG